MAGSNSRIVDDEQSVNIAADPRPEHHDTLEAQRREQRIPFADVPRFQVRRKKKTQHDHGEFAIDVLGLEFCFDIGPSQDRQEASFTRIRAQEMDCVPAVEFQDHIRACALVKPGPVLCLDPNLGGLTAGQQQ